ISQMTNLSDKERATEILIEWHSTAIEIKQLNTVDIAASAYDFMNYSAYSLLGVIWLSMADMAQKSSNESVKSGKANTCAFYMKRILPRKELFKANLCTGAADLMAVTDIEFDYL
ncbi:MAG: acyl-CoA dehydrogenase C-terminal domain-containing protein, partial [Paraglaciecola sp.]